MRKIEEFLRPGEEIADQISKIDRSRLLGAINFTIHTLRGAHIIEGEDVLLEIRNRSDECVLIGGKELQLHVLNGIGRLTVVNLTNGIRGATDLWQGARTTVSPDNSLYWYANFGGPNQPLIVRAHCEGFDPTNEPTLEDVVDVFTGLLPPEVRELTAPQET